MSGKRISGQATVGPDAQLDVSDIEVGVGNVRLLTGLSFKLSEGELAALVGPSGCGKTTLLRAIVGLVDPLAGEVRHRGQTADEMGWPVFRRRVVYVEQAPVMLDVPVWSNLSRPFSYRVAGCEFPEARARDLLSAVGLDGRTCALPARLLSAGQQQRVSLVRALLVQPEVLLLDEPTNALDEVNMALVERLLRQAIDAAGMAALVVTHDRMQAERWCDRVIDLGPFISVGAVARDTCA